MSKSNPNIYEERESLGSRPSKGTQKEEWVEESFGQKTVGNSGKKPRNNSKTRVKKK